MMPGGQSHAARVRCTKSRAPAALADQFGEVDERLTIDRLLSSLPPRERAIVELRFFAGLTQSEIAERVGLSQMHISRLLTQSLGRLREQATTTPG